MENRKTVDQPAKLEQFLTQYRDRLAVQGTIVAAWRNKNGMKSGPYFRLTCRDATGVQRSVYLGLASPAVEEARAALAELQSPAAESRRLQAAQRVLRRGLRAAREILDSELDKVGLYRKGSEIRGWTGLRSRAATLSPSAGPPARVAPLSTRSPDLGSDMSGLAKE